MTNFRITAKQLFLAMLALPVSVAAGPIEQNNQWPVSTLAAESIEESALLALDAEIRAGTHGNIDSLLLIRHGRIVFERRYSRNYAAINAPSDAPTHQTDNRDENWNPWHQNDSGLHTIQSVSKSVLAVLYGIALQQGALQSVDVPALALLEGREFADPDGRKAQITMSDLLTMRDGIAWDEDSCYDDTDPRNVCAQMNASEDWVQFVLELPMAADPGSRWVYNGGSTMLLAEILQNLVGQSVTDYAEEGLFAPLGIRSYYWESSPTGLADVKGGLYLRPRDLARIMQLWLNEGRWGDQQIVPAAWVRNSVSPATPQTYPDSPTWENVGYGYLWWDFTAAVGKKMKAYGGVGSGGQWPVAIPGLDLIIVITGWNINKASISHLEIIRDRILPAVH